MKQLLLCFVVLVLLAAVVCVRAQLPRCNAAPMTLSGSMSQVSFNADECVNMKDYGMIYMDFSNMMSRVDLSVQGSDPITAWIDYDSQMQYILDRKTNKCESMTFDYPMGSNTLPANAKYTGSYFIGTQETDTYWIDSYPGFPGWAFETVVVTGTCFPVSTTIVNTTSQMSIVLVETLWNIVDTVPPYVFDIPAMCKSSLVKRSSAIPNLRLMGPKFLLI